MIGTLAAAAPAAPAVSEPSHGRVIRVERGFDAAVPPRLCELRKGPAGVCVGEQPRPGQQIILVGEQGVLGDAVVTDATSMGDGCAHLWTVQIEAHTTLPDTGVLGVIDRGLDPQAARMLDHDHFPAPPSGNPAEEIWRAVDRDGDGTADVLFTHYPCDAASNITSGARGFCIDVWARLHGKLTRTTQVNFAQCKL